MLGDRRLDRSRLFMDDADRERFVERLAERVEQHEIRLYLFVLMTNHFHLVFETPRANCSRFMQSILTAHTVYYNLRHDRHGHLFDGRFKSRLVEGDDYLSALSRYVHLNPVKTKSAERKSVEDRIRMLRDYPWSTYPGYVNKRKALDFIEYGPVLGQMPGKRAQWRGQYRRFVEAGLAQDDEELKTALEASPLSLGSDGFRAWVENLHERRAEGQATKDDVAFRRMAAPLPVEIVLAEVAGGLGVELAALRERRRNSPLRAVAALMLIRFGGRTQRQVAADLAMGTGGAVARQLRSLPDRLAEGRTLRNAVRRLEERLTKVTTESAQR